MAVAHDASSSSHTSGTFSISEASFNWTHTPVGTPRGVRVAVFNISSATDIVSSVTYGGVTMSAVTGGSAADTATEPLRVTVFELNSSVPTGAQTVQVNRTNNANNLGAFAWTVTAGADVESTGVTLEQENQALTEENIDDGSPGTNSVRYLVIASGFATVSSNLPAGTHSSVQQINEAGARGAVFVMESAAGQGSRPVGVVQATADDVAAVYLAIREVVAATGQPTRRRFGGVRFAPGANIPNRQTFATERAA